MAKKPQTVEPTTGGPAASSTDTKTPASTSSLRQCFDAIQAGDDESAKRFAAAHLREIISRSSFKDEQILILFDDEAISDFHADRLYAAASSDQALGKPILLILHSPGGSIEPAYLISKTLRRLSTGNFKVAIPRRAKSAATLLSLGASEIHMGMMSQLGPIDPQFAGLPALALANALDVIADVSCRFPASIEMLTKYLAEQIPIRHLGYFQRINDSAIQYAVRLLAEKAFAGSNTAESIAQHLVNYYKDHNFVIDADEARNLLGDKIIRENTNEYYLADAIFTFLDFLQFFADEKGKRFFWVGSPDDSGAFIWSRPLPPPQSGTKPVVQRQ
jgi:hypothetical protein